MKTDPSTSLRASWKKILAVALGLVVLVGLTYLVLWLKPEAGSSGVEPPPVVQNETSTVARDVSGWKTYRNEEYGFEVKYLPNSVAGEAVPYSSLSSGGIYIGPTIFVILDNPNVIQEATKFLDEVVGASSESYVDEGPSYSCVKDKIQNSSVEIDSTYCTGEGGPAFYALIHGSKFNIFVDSYSPDRFHSYGLRGKELADSVGKMLSTFKFIEPK